MIRKKRSNSRVSKQPRSKDVPKLSRLVSHVGNLKRASDFYSTLLGIEGRPVGGGRVYFECGPVILALLDPAQGGIVPRPNPDTIYFTVRDVDKVFGDDVHGGPAGEIAGRPWGEGSFYAEDEWGNGLCFVDEKTLFKGDRIIR